MIYIGILMFKGVTSALQVIRWDKPSGDLTHKAKYNASVVSCQFLVRPRYHSGHAKAWLFHVKITNKCD